LPLLVDGGAGFIAGARLFHRTFGFKLGGSAIFRIGCSGIRGGGAAARRRAGLGSGGAMFRTVAELFLATTGNSAGAGARCGCGSGFGRATIAGFFGCGSMGSGSGSTSFALREAARVEVK